MSATNELEKIISITDELIVNQSDSENPRFKAWYTRVEIFLADQYGEKSIQLNKFYEIEFEPRVLPLSEVDSYDYIGHCVRGLNTAKAYFTMYLEQLKGEEDTADNTQKLQCANYNKVFIVHGHDGELKHAVARMIEKQDSLKAIILSEQINPGKTIIEKIEENSDVAGAICLFTADDLGRAKADTEDKPRARQNVVFEAGYFMGKLGRDHVVMICEDGVEIPGDLSGVVYTGKNHWEVEMLKALKVMGYNIDMNKLFE